MSAGSPESCLDFSDPLDVPVGGSIASSNAMSMTMSDVRVSRNVIEAKKPIDRVQSLAEAIIFSMSEDAPVPPVASEAATPGNVTPMPSAISRLQNGASMKRTASGDSLAAAGKKSEENRKFLGGSKALDHLSRLLTSLETVIRKVVAVCSRAHGSVLSPQQLGELELFPDRVPASSFHQLCRAVEVRGRTPLQDTKRMAVDLGHQAGLCAHNPAACPHGHVQQGAISSGFPDEGDTS